MQANPSTLPSNNNGNRWLRHFWGALPALTVIVLIVVILMLFFWIVAKANATKERQSNALRQEVDPAMVVAMELVPGVVQERINLPGVVHPWVEIDAVAEVSGIIADKRIVKGQSVKKGDILAVIDNRDYNNSYISARAAYRASKTSYDRLDQLLKNNVASQAQIDEARALLETSKAAMDNAKLRLERTVIRSPLSGVVDQTFIENGQYVNSGDKIVNILQIDRLKVAVGIPESDVDAVRRVKDFKVTIDALGGRVFKGRFSFLSRSSQSLARLYDLEIALDNSRGDILPDMFARVDIVKQEVADGLAVPLFSLIPRQDGSPVLYIAENGIARLREVETGIQEGWRIQITKGLLPGDMVVVVGHRGLNSGAPINVVRTVREIEELNQ